MIKINLCAKSFKMIIILFTKTSHQKLLFFLYSIIHVILALTYSIRHKGCDSSKMALTRVFVYVKRVFGRTALPYALQT